MAKGTALQRAQNFIKGAEVQRALAGGDPRYASSVFYRAQIETDPAAKKYLQGYADQLRAKGIAPEIAGTTQSWQGKSHNFFAQHPWIAPVAAALIPGVGPVAGAAIGLGAKAASGVGSHYKPSLKDIALGGVEGAAGGAANKLALGGRGVAGLPGLASKAAPVLKTAGQFALGKVGSVADAIAKDPIRAAQLGLAAAGTLSGAEQMGQANAIRRRAISGTSDLGLPAGGYVPPDLTGTLNRSNPYARAGGAPGAGNAARVAALAALQPVAVR